MDGYVRHVRPPPTPAHQHQIHNTTSGTTPHCLALDTPYLAMNAVTALAFGAVVYSMASLRPGLEHFLFYYCSLVSGPADRPTSPFGLTPTQSHPL